MDRQFNAIHSRHDHIRYQQRRTFALSRFYRILRTSEGSRPKAGCVEDRG